MPLSLLATASHWISLPFVVVKMCPPFFYDLPACFLDGSLTSSLRSGFPSCFSALLTAEREKRVSRCRCLCFCFSAHSTDSHSADYWSISSHSSLSLSLSLCSPPSPSVLSVWVDHSHDQLLTIQQLPPFSCLPPLAACLLTRSLPQTLPDSFRVC